MKSNFDKVNGYFDLNNLLNQDLVGISVIQNSDVVLTNDKFLNIFQIDSSVKTNIYSLFDSDKTASLKTLLTACLKGIKTDAHFKIPGNKNNTKSFYEVYITKTEFKSNPAILLVVFDISKRVHALRREEKYKIELIYESKMAAIGRMAAGIAHNLNTPIAIIQGNAELLNGNRSQ